MPPLLGGVAVSSGRLFNNLKDDGYDVEVYNIRPVGRFYNSPLGIVWCFLKIPFYILFRRKYDIVHCHVSGTWRKVYISIAKYLCFRGAKLIYTLHGDVRLLLNAMSIWALNKADMVICVQKGDSDILTKYIGSRSVDIPAFILPKNLVSETLPTNVLNFVEKKESPLILYYGGVVINDTFDDLYGINDAIDLYMHFKLKRIEIRMLMLVSYKKDVNSSFLSGIKDRIAPERNICLIENGSIEMLYLFKYADLYIRPTKTDGDSLAVREALMMHCPVVASNAAIRPNGTGVYSTKEEFFKLCEEYLSKKVDLPDQDNYYNKIKDIYENC